MQGENAPARDLASTRPLVSVISPAYHEEQNLHEMYGRLCAALDDVQFEWEWLIIEDGSTDGTYAVATAISRSDSRVRPYRFSRNFGSHRAIACGLDHARGDCAIVMACDLQDPPETIRRMLGAWRAGNHVVWALRAKREGESRTTLAFSKIYHWTIHRVANSVDAAGGGSDFVLLDRIVIDAIKRFGERNTSIFALVTWMGFRQTSISYVKKARRYGRSGWTLRKKIKLVIDALTSFTYLPIRLMSVIGLAVTLIGFFFGASVLIHALFVGNIRRWASVIASVLFLGGGQMFMLGVLGEYIWRGLDESRRRPRYILEATPDAGPKIREHTEVPDSQDPCLIESLATSNPHKHEKET